MSENRERDADHAMLQEAAIEREAQLIVDNIECASQVPWKSDSHRDDAVRNVRAGLQRFLAAISSHAT